VRVDRAVLDFVVRHRDPALTRAMDIVTTLGASVPLLLVVAVLGGWWWFRRRTWVPLVLLLAALAGAHVTFSVMKVAIGRHRPPAALAVHRFSGLAFPSGHAAQAAAVWGMWAVLASAHARGRGRLGVWAVALLVIVAVGCSRIYLGAHWLTDVLGGWVVGAVWVVGLVAASRGFRRQTSMFSSVGSRPRRTSTKE
jgi:membrane-associated phospholipid phosphatase